MVAGVVALVLMWGVGSRAFSFLFLAEVPFRARPSQPQICLPDSRQPAFQFHASLRMRSLPQIVSGQDPRFFMCWDISISCLEVAHPARSLLSEMLLRGWIRLFVHCLG